MAMRRIRRVTDARQLRAGLELLDAVAPGSVERGGRGFAHYWALIRAGADSVWCAEDDAGLVGIFLGTPKPGHPMYYDAVLAPGTDPDRVLADLVDAGSAAAYVQGHRQLFSHDPIDGAERYEELGHVPTLRVQINGPDRTTRRRELIRDLDPDHRILNVEGETRRWAGASFRVDRVDRVLQAQLSDPHDQQWAMYMMHRWAEPARRTRYVVSGYGRFRRATIAELREVDPDLATVRRLHDDAVEVDAGRPGHDLVPASAAKPVTFAHAITAVDLGVELTGDADDIDRIVTAALTLHLAPGRTFAVRCRKGRHSVGGAHAVTPYTVRDVEIAVGTALFVPDVHPVDVTDPDQIISVYLAPEGALLGLGPPIVADHTRLRSTAPTVVSRAEHKLAEAMAAFNVTWPAKGTALDLGAAPGGWSHLLAERGLLVYAVDPGELHPAVATHPRVVHLRHRAETLKLPGQVDLIVNDTNLDPLDSATLMSDVAHLLRPDAYAVMTIKLPSPRPMPTIRAAHDRLSTRYAVLATRHLPHNRQEVTTLLRRSR